MDECEEDIKVIVPINGLVFTIDKPNAIQLKCKTESYLDDFARKYNKKNCQEKG